MPLPADLLDLLRCPACHQVVRPLADESGLECVGCRRIYPIEGGIPMMLVESAKSPSS